MTATRLPRIGALAAIVALFAALLVAVASAPAQADDITCPENPPRGSGHVIAGKWLHVIHLKYAEPAFFKGNGTVIENETDANASRTATVAVSQTHHPGGHLGRRDQDDHQGRAQHDRLVQPDHHR